MCAVYTELLLHGRTELAGGSGGGGSESVEWRADGCSHPTSDDDATDGDDVLLPRRPERTDIEL